MTAVPSRESSVAHARSSATPTFALRALPFGSVARGEHDETSDTDVLVVSPDVEGVPGARRGRPFRDRWNYERCGSVDFVAYTPAEYDDCHRRADGLAGAVEREGIPLVNPNGRRPMRGVTVRE